MRGGGKTRLATSQLPSTPTERKAQRSGAGEVERTQRRADREAPRTTLPVLCCTRNRDDGRGLNPSPDERRPAVVEYDDGCRSVLEELQLGPNGGWSINRAQARRCV